MVRHLHDQMALHLTNTELIFRPTDDSSGSLCIDRQSGQIQVLPASPSSGQGKKKIVYGIIGHVTTPDGSQTVIAVVTKKVRTGEIAGHTVWRVEEIELVNQRLRSEDEEAADDDTAKLRQALVNVLATPYFYFASTGDLTRSQQRQAEEAAEDKGADLRFFFNHHLLGPFLSASRDNSDIDHFLVPLIHGALFNHQCTINGKNFSWSLISRRSCRRVGARLFMRGCDAAGNVANFVETEQIVESDSGALASFVQTRGSIPMCWQQYPDLRYKPPPTLIHELDSAAAYLAHYKEQLALYGEQISVCLVDHKGAEGELEKQLKGVVEDIGLTAVKYVSFDFHGQCKKMRYDKLSILMDQLIDFIRDHDYFFTSKRNDPSAAFRQKGVIRTNCIDSLDRTNVVQSLIANENLKLVLLRLGILTPQDDIRKQATFQHVYRNTWADNADLLSIQYAGTGALKTDYTRTGKRTTNGLLQDGWNASTRYYLNNFADGARTDALRVFVGEVTPESFLLLHRRGAHRHPRGSLAYLPYLLGMVFLVLTSTLIFTSETSGQFWAIIITCFIFFAFISKLIVENGSEFVNAPVTLKKIW